MERYKQNLTCIWMEPKRRDERIEMLCICHLDIARTAVVFLDQLIQPVIGTRVIIGENQCIISSGQDYRRHPVKVTRGSYLFYTLLHPLKLSAVILHFQTVNQVRIYC